MKSQKSKIPVDRQARISLQVLITYVVNNETVTMFCSNLSEGGLFIETTKPHPVGTKLKVSFNLPMEKSPFSFEALVVWVKKDGAPGMGLKFENIDADMKIKLDKAVAYFHKMLGI